MGGIAPGRPGIAPRWTSSAKQAVGTARSPASPVWFTVSHGILNEVYYPRIDRACLRDAELLVVTDDRLFEEKRDGVHETTPIEPGVPAFLVTTTDPEGRFTIRKRFATDPRRPTLLVDVTFVRSDPDTPFPTVAFLVAPHLANHGAGNTAWVDEYKGTPTVSTVRDDTALSVALSAPVRSRSVGYVGVSDPWQVLHRDHAFVDGWDRADDGNVAFALEPDLEACDGRFTVALGFGTSPAEAGQHAVGSLRDGFDACLERYRAEWRAWSDTVRVPDPDDPVATTGATVLATHEDKTFPGGLIASLSIPWGSARGDDDLGGYHLVWPRDHAEAAGALFAIGAVDDGLRALSHLRATQEADGHWAQNAWLDGTPYWQGVQLDETAFPILLVDLARTVGAIDAEEIVARYWPMMRNAATYLVRSGPVTGQDRWEEDGGYSPFTLAAVIAALLTAAEVAELADEAGLARYLRETADTWNAHIESWCHVRGTELARLHGVDGYYVRIGPPDVGGAASPLDGWVPIKNRPPAEAGEPARSVVSPDALALVRFGLRRADDPRILDTVRVIDATLRSELPYGPGWHRYGDDGYGEHPDGSPFDGEGQGRVWPLLTGERGHYELAAGNLEDAACLARTMQAMAGDGWLLPEQTWDAADIPARELVFGRPAGSAMPLVWAHAEYLKLGRSLAEGKVFDLPGAVGRHRPDAAAACRRFWRANHKIQEMEAGSTLRVELLAPARLHWSVDGWATAADTPTADTGAGVHVVDLDTADLPVGSDVVFTARFARDWEHEDHRVRVVEPSR